MQLRGVHSVREALRARRRKLERLLVARPRDPRHPNHPDLQALAREAGIAVVEVSPDEVAGAAERGDNAQGVWLEAGPLAEVPLERLGGGQSPRLLVALDGVEDPQNVGALVRVAEAAGVQGLVLTERRAPPLSPALARASAGAIEWLPVSRVANLPRALDQLRERGFWVVGGDPAAPDSVFAAPDRVLTGDLVLVLGAEGRGLRPAVRKRVDHPVSIPMGGQVGSLNVAAAGAVLLFEIRRRAEAKERA